MCSEPLRALKARKVRHVAMESTGVYWQPVWNELESTKWKFDLLLDRLMPALAAGPWDRATCLFKIRFTG